MRPKKRQHGVAAAEAQAVGLQVDAALVAPQHVQPEYELRPVLLLQHRDGGRHIVAGHLQGGLREGGSGTEHELKIVQNNSIL